MKKKLHLLIFILMTGLIGINTYAQINGTTNIAPNFIKYDTEQVEHNLYTDYLDNNIPVVLDIMAYWCPPCWSYSNTGALEDVYNQYGPNGTITPNKVMVFMADGDANSTFTELYDTNNTQGIGNWMAITGYPVFGGDTGLGANAGDEIGNLYQITYFPTIYLIHPDRTIEEIGQLSASSIMSAVNNANMLSNLTNDASLTYAFPMNSTCNGGELIVNYIMKNSTSNLMIEATLDVEVDGTVIETINWFGGLEAYELTSDIATVILTDITPGNHTLELIVKTVNGTTDEDASNNNIFRTFSINETDKRYYTLKVKTDNNGNETNWFIRNGNDEIVYRRSDFNDGPYENSTLYEHSLDLREATCYKLVVTDSDGDGMSGYVNLKDESGIPIAHIIVDEVIAEASWQSTVVSSISELKNGYISVHPNPVKNILNIDLSAGNSVNVSYDLVNILGQSVESKNLGVLSGTNNLSINTVNLNEGVYILTVQMGDEKITERIIK